MVDLGDLGPVRCSRCKAYINAFTRWADGGKAFACNFCGALTPCPEPYFCYLGPDGRRRDADERPELCKCGGGGGGVCRRACGGRDADQARWLAAASAARVTLPGSGAVESLNVSVAAAVLIHALWRQRTWA